MEPRAARARKPGLRELKKKRTRETILNASLELFAERGYAHTTLEDIAEAAEVSTGTLFAYFPNKEDILFPEERPFYEQLKQRLDQRPPGTSTFDVLRELLATLEPPDETFPLRVKILNGEGLRDRQRSRYMRVEHLLADSIAKDLGAAPDDLRPILLAASASAGLAKVGERLQPQSGEAISYDQALSILEQMFQLLRGGLNERKPPRRRHDQRERNRR
jgi:AcrR family transcriptional regulator